MFYNRIKLVYNCIQIVWMISREAGELMDKLQRLKTPEVGMMVARTKRNSG